MNDIDERLQKLEKAVWKLGHDLNETQRVIDLLLLNDPECEVTKHFVERAKKNREYKIELKKTQEKIRDMRCEIADLLMDYPELREANENRR